jgi:hypothetical protein
VIHFAVGRILGTALRVGIWHEGERRRGIRPDQTQTGISGISAKAELTFDVLFSFPRRVSDSFGPKNWEEGQRSSFFLSVKKFKYVSKYKFKYMDWNHVEPKLSRDFNDGTA